MCTPLLVQALAERLQLPSPLAPAIEQEQQRKRALEAVALRAAATGAATQAESDSFFAVARPKRATILTPADAFAVSAAEARRREAFENREASRQAGLEDFRSGDPQRFVDRLLKFYRLRPDGNVR